MRAREVSFLMEFLRDDEGQDMVEYTLLLAFIALSAAAVFSGISVSLAAIWTTANSSLNAAAKAAQ